MSLDWIILELAAEIKFMAAKVGCQSLIRIQHLFFPWAFEVLESLMHLNISDYLPRNSAATDAFSTSTYTGTAISVDFMLANSINLYPY